jgi:hypothetical protein
LRGFFAVILVNYGVTVVLRLQHLKF